MRLIRLWPDGTQFDFKGLTATGEPREDGDKAFDPEDFGAMPALPGLSVVKL